MAIQYARLEYISRRKRMNACLRSAYNGNLKIKDYRINKTFNFLNNKTKVYHEVLLPIPKIADRKYMNIEKLMNEVENCERRKNSQLLREYIIALPSEKEITLRHKISLTKLFIRKLSLLKENLAIVMDIHSPKEDDVNWYSKILVTTRRFTKDGRLLGEKARDLNTPIRRNQGKVFIPKALRMDNGDVWKEVQNSFFEFCNMSIRVDEIGEIPQEHIGVKKYGILAEAKRNKEECK